MVKMPSPDQPQTPEATRRGFFEAAIYGMMGLISVALAAPAAVYLFTPAKEKNQGSWAEAGDIGKLAPNSPVELVFRRHRFDGWREIVDKGTAWVVRRDDNRVVAFGPSCTHLGCPYHWDDQSKNFLCPCHNSVFSIDGKVVSGPAPRPLDRFDTKTDGARLMIGDLKRSSESQG
jgi:menaquinol-cytochrome c reductase iron-sulfur subunit